MKYVLALVLTAACSKGAAKVDQRQNIELTTVAVKKLAFEAYPQWAAAHPDKACPAKLEDLFEYVDKDTGKPDPWGHAYKMMCGPTLPSGAKGLAILSLGPDGKEATTDDIKSW